MEPQAAGGSAGADADAARTPTTDYAFFVGSPRGADDSDNRRELPRGDAHKSEEDGLAGVDALVDAVVDAVVESPGRVKSANGSDSEDEAGGNAGEGEGEGEEEAVRYVHINAPTANAALGYCSNTVVTSRFTLYNFLPKLLFYEFSKLANAYFLVISVMQAIKPISNTGGFPASLPALSIIVLIDMFFACMEDYKRHKADHVANNLPCLRYDLGDRSFRPTKWHEVQVGDVLKVSNREAVPADMVILGASEPEPENPAGICYVETKSLDGETNLKLRQGLEVTYTAVLNDRAVGDLCGRVVCETPNNSIHRFSGSMTVQGGQKEVITTNAVVLRGSTVRNTEYIYGLVVNTGPDTKIMMASSSSPIKWSNMERRLNQQIRYICFLMIALCLIGAICSTVWNHANLSETHGEGAWYLYDASSLAVKAPAGNFVVMVLYYFLLLNSFIPVSLYVSMTSVKFMQSYFMNNDLEMYHAETDTPFQVRTMSLNEELGQIDYVFSDKTGTLTCNVMEFRKCSINGVAYGMGETEVGIAARRRQQEEDGLSSFHAVTPFAKPAEPAAAPAPDRVISAPYVNYQDDALLEALAHPSTRQATHIGQFFEHLAVCHTVMPERASDGSLRLSASSPDEQALVAAAGCFGYKFVGRAPGKAIIEYFSTAEHPEMMTDPQPKRENAVGAYQILEVLEFNSTRKRMSVIVRTPDGALKVLCKGADTVMYERLRATTDADALRTRSLTLKHMEEFASEGLRTLVIGVAELDPAVYDSWVVRYRTAINDMRQIALRRDGEENDIDRLMEEVERDLEVLGATAIEDRLQAEVPSTIFKLRQASIKVWMLTGDKEETAINIGYACRLLSADIERLVISADTHPDLESIVEELEACVRERERMEEAAGQEEVERATPVTASASSASSATPKVDPRRLTRIESMAVVREQLALVIDGETLELALDECPELLLRVAEQCVAVIACRVSPAQKAELVQLVRANKPEVRTLAIGDGANDVSMIQVAHVGVGISGLEGMQAANSSDYSIAQFRFLSRLLFVHGRWNYVRMGKLILYIFYKNVMLNLTQFWYMAYGGFSGQKFFLEWGLQGYNLLFTALPIVLVSTFEQDVPAHLAAAFPLLYRIGQENRHFNTKVVWSWILSCVWESLVVCFGTLLGMRYLIGMGETPTMWVYGCAAFTIALLVVTLKLALHQQMWWRAVHFPIYLGSFSLWIGTAAFISHGRSVSSAYWNGVFSSTFGVHAFWLIVPIIVFTALSRDVLSKGYVRAFRPSYKHLAQEVHAFGLTPIADQLLAFPPPDKMPPMAPRADLEAASGVGDVAKPSTSTPAAVAVTAPARRLMARLGRASSGRQLRPTRGSAFSYDAESVMVESFMASERFRSDNPRTFRALFDRHASRGSLAFHDQPEDRVRRGRELLGAPAIDEATEPLHRSLRAATATGDFANAEARQHSVGNLFRGARHSRGRRRLLSGQSSERSLSLRRDSSSAALAASRSRSRARSRNRSTGVGGSTDAMDPRSSLRAGESRSFLRGLLRSFIGAPAADADASADADESVAAAVTPRPTPLVRRYAHSTSQRQLQRQATL